MSKLVFEVVLRSKPIASQSIEEKHAKLVAGWSLLEGDWKPVGGAIPNPPLVGGDLSSILNLRSVLPKGRRGRVSYAYRAPNPPDDGMWDDWLAIEFDPGSTDFAAFCRRTFREFIKAFTPYVGHVRNIEFSEADFEKWRNLNIRKTISRFASANFVSRELCESSFSMSPERIQRKLEGHVDLVDLTQGGILIVSAFSVLPFDEERQIDARIRGLLGVRAVV